MPDSDPALLRQKAQKAIDSLRAEVERLQAELSAKWGDKALGEGNWIKHECPLVGGKVATHSTSKCCTDLAASELLAATVDRLGQDVRRSEAEVERLRDALAAVVDENVDLALSLRALIDTHRIKSPHSRDASAAEAVLSRFGAPSTPPTPT